MALQASAFVVGYGNRLIGFRFLPRGHGRLAGLFEGRPDCPKYFINLA